MKPSEFAHFCDGLLTQGRFEYIDVSLLELDHVCRQLLDRATYVSGLRGVPLPAVADEHPISLLDSIQQPLLGYRKKNDAKISVISGVFTYHRLMQQLSTDKPVINVPIFLLDKTPRPAIRELLLLNELTRNLLKQCYINSSSKLADYLYTWFDCHPNKTLFETEQWQLLFPSIKTKSELCNWLEISSKTFIPSYRMEGVDD